MSLAQLGVLSILTVLTFSISFSVSSLEQRCMIVYGFGDHHVKVDMKFEKFPAQTPYEFYQIQLINTEDNTIQQFTIEEGNFRKEFQLTENVVYKLCTKIVLNRYGSTQIQKFVEYKASMKHYTPLDDKGIEIPESLLKVKDLSETHRKSLHLLDFFQQLKTASEQQRKSEEVHFNYQAEKIKNIEIISFVELGAICVFGVYQYFRLKNALDGKQAH